MIKILFLAANSTDAVRLRLSIESRAIDRILRKGDSREIFELQQHGAVRFRELESILHRFQPQIVHFIGHSSAFPEITLEDETGKSHPVSGNALKQLFSIPNNVIHCVILDACFSRTQAHYIAEEIDVVIGIPITIDDSSSIAFSSGFYQALGYGRDIATAFQLGSLQIELENIEAQDKPVLLAGKSNSTESPFINSEREIKNRISSDKKFEQRVSWRIKLSQIRRTITPILVASISFLGAILANLFANTITTDSVLEYSVLIWIFFGFTLVLTLLLAIIQNREQRDRESIVSDVRKHIHTRDIEILGDVQEAINKEIVISAGKRVINDKSNSSK